ncbi:MAG: hypothetical protein WDW38_004799 [Sanguina aurantia]
MTCGTRSVEGKRRAPLSETRQAHCNGAYATEQQANGVRHSSVPVDRGGRRDADALTGALPSPSCVLLTGPPHPIPAANCSSVGYPFPSAAHSHTHSMFTNLISSSSHRARAAGVAEETLVRYPTAGLDDSSSIPPKLPGTMDGIGHPILSGSAPSHSSTTTGSLNTEPTLQPNHLKTPENRRDHRLPSPGGGGRRPPPADPSLFDLRSDPSAGSSKFSGDTLSGGSSKTQLHGGRGNQRRLPPVSGNGEGMNALRQQPGDVNGGKGGQQGVLVQGRGEALRMNPVARSELESKVRDHHTDRAEAEAIAAVKAAEDEARKAAMIEEFQIARSTGRPSMSTKARRVRSRSPSRAANMPKAFNSSAGEGGFGEDAQNQGMREPFSMYYDPAPHSSLADQAATAIQKNWKAHSARKSYLLAREQVCMMQRMVRARYGATAMEARRCKAANLIMQFLAVCARAGLAKSTFKAASKYRLAKVRVEKDLNLMHPLRIAMLVRQWAAVEGALRDSIKQRTGSIDSGLKALTAAAATAVVAKKGTQLLKQSLAARKKGILILSTDSSSEWLGSTDTC